MTNKPTLKKRKTDIEQIKESAHDSEQENFDYSPNKGDFSKVISTGSTLLDLDISGGVKKEGGVPGGILLEVSGESGTGKTGVLAELAGSTQVRGGDVEFADPEARVNEAYIKYYGVNIAEYFNYCRPDTVMEMFNLMYNWEPKPKIKDAINLFGGDSIAALSTEIEMEDQDKMGGKRAKDISAGLRKTCRKIANNNWVIAFSNQLRQDMKTSRYTTPGGMGIPFYASLRIRLTPSNKGSKIEKEVKLASGVIVKEIIGIRSDYSIVKSSIDKPFRKGTIYILFNYGIDDVRANLQYIKDMRKDTKYDAFTKQYVAIEDAIKHIEEEDYELKLRHKTIELWNEIQALFKINRKEKQRN